MSLILATPKRIFYISKMGKLLISFQIYSLLIHAQIATLSSTYVILFLISFPLDGFLVSFVVVAVDFIFVTHRKPLRFSISETIFYSLTLWINHFALIFIAAYKIGMVSIQFLEL